MLQVMLSIGWLSEQFRSMERVSQFACAVTSVLNNLEATGEHGVGVGKKAYLIPELGRGTVELMWVIKRAIDPLNIMNPGKVKSKQLLTSLLTHVKHSYTLMSNTNEYTG